MTELPHLVWLLHLSHYHLEKMSNVEPLQSEKRGWKVPASYAKRVGKERFRGGEAQTERQSEK